MDSGDGGLSSNLSTRYKIYLLDVLLPSPLVASFDGSKSQSLQVVCCPSCRVCLVAPDAGLPVYQELDTKLPIFVAQNTLKNG